jgi:hypothetical protein
MDLVDTHTHTTYASADIWTTVSRRVWILLMQYRLSAAAGEEQSMQSSSASSRATRKSRRKTALYNDFHLQKQIVANTWGGGQTHIFRLRDYGRSRTDRQGSVWHFGDTNIQFVQISASTARAWKAKNWTMLVPVRHNGRQKCGRCLCESGMMKGKGFNMV